MRYVGFDWASQAHDVTVLDEAGGVLERWAFPHSESGSVITLDRLARHGPASELPVIIERTSGLIVDGCWLPAIRSCRCIPQPSTLPGPGGVLPGPSPIPVTATNSPTISVRMGIGCGGWNPPTPAWWSCRRWSGSVMIRSGHAQRRRTS
jgi:hypothetical protein